MNIPIKCFVWWFVGLLASAIAGHAADAGLNPAATNSPIMDAAGYPTNLVAAYALGQADARHDLTNGVVCLKHIVGEPDKPETFVYIRILDERCRVRSEYKFNELGSVGLPKYVEGYNAVASAYIQQKFGTNIFEQLQQQASDQVRHGTFYAVQVGDSLLKIARRFGISLKMLRAANPALDPTKLRIGQKINIPPIEP